MGCTAPTLPPPVEREDGGMIDHVEAACHLPE